MPPDTNPLDDIFGGWLMCQMDLAASSVATRRAEGAATVAADSMTFLRPVKVGDEVSGSTRTWNIPAGRRSAMHYAGAGSGGNVWRVVSARES